MRGALGRLHDDRLGDFEFQGAAFHALAVQYRLDILDEVGIDQLQRGNVDGGENGIGRPEGALPDAELASRLAQHNAADVADHAGLFGEADETFGKQESENRMAPAGERLEARQIHVGEPGDRLIMNFDFVALDGTSQFLLECQQFAASVAHRDGEDFDSAGAAPLGFIEGDRRILQHLRGRIVRLARGGDADAGGQEDFPVGQRDRPSHGFTQAFGKSLGIARRLGRRQKKRELAAGQAGHRIGGSGGGNQPAADDRQQAVAHLMAETVIDGLEAVDVDKQHVGSRGLRFRQHPPQPVEEQGAIGQSGHPVIDGIVEEAFLGALGDGHIGEGADATDGAAAVARHGAAAQLEPAIGTVAVTHAEFGLDHAAALPFGGIDSGAIDAAVGGVHQFEKGLDAGLAH